MSAWAIMERRKFITLLGSAAGAFPLSVRAQQTSTIPIVGFLHGGSQAPYAQMVSAFRKGLSETGFDEGRNVVIEYRWADGNYDRLPGLADELVNRHIAVLYTSGGSVSALAAKEAARGVPLVFLMGSDPVKAGLVPSLNRPGGNATGLTLFTVELEAKRLEILRQLLPSLTVVAALINPSNPNAEDVTNYLQSAANALGLEARVLQAATEAELDKVLGNLPKANAMLVGNDPFFVSQRAKIIAAAARNSLPAIYQSREFPASGGLASYGSNLSDMYRKSGVYVGQVLKGIKPSDLPVQQPTTFELVINLKTAKALGLELPPTLLAGADEVIE
jgi:putative tryptophan/tyrosine transport system substrate-binding protein